MANFFAHPLHKDPASDNILSKLLATWQTSSNALTVIKSRIAHEERKKSKQYSKRRMDDLSLGDHLFMAVRSGDVYERGNYSPITPTFGCAKETHPHSYSTFVASRPPAETCASWWPWRVVGRGPLVGGWGGGVHTIRVLAICERSVLGGAISREGLYGLVSPSGGVVLHGGVSVLSSRTWD